VDNSDYVIKILKKTFGDQKSAVIIKSTHSNLEEIGTNSVDFVFSISTFVHLYIEQIYGYFKEFYRILNSQGKCVVHFANFMEDGGYDFFIGEVSKKDKYDRLSVFRFYHPEMLEKIAVKIGLTVEKRTIIPNTRHCFLVLNKVQ
jgi:ubiquinone/menaquinone biosynthesis C-methylase UbiE